MTRPLTLAERQARSRAKRAAEVETMREALRRIATEARTIVEARALAAAVLPQNNAEVT